MRKIRGIDGLERSEGVQPQPTFTKSGRNASKGESKEFRDRFKCGESFLVQTAKFQKSIAIAGKNFIQSSFHLGQITHRIDSFNSRPNQYQGGTWGQFVKLPTDWASPPVRAKISSKTSGIKKNVGP